MSNGNDFFGAFRQFTIQAVDGLNGLIGQRSVNESEYESEAKSLLKSTPEAIQIVVLDGDGNFFDYITRD